MNSIISFFAVKKFHNFSNGRVSAKYRKLLIQILIDMKLILIKDRYKGSNQFKIVNN